MPLFYPQKYLALEIFWFLSPLIRFQAGRSCPNPEVAAALLCWCLERDILLGLEEPCRAAVAAAWCPPRGPVSCSLCQKTKAASCWPILWVSKIWSIWGKDKNLIGKGFIWAVGFFLLFAGVRGLSYHIALVMAGETENYSENWQNVSVPKTNKVICGINLGNNMYHLSPCSGWVD